MARLTITSDGVMFAFAVGLIFTRATLFRALVGVPVAMASRVERLEIAPPVPANSPSTNGEVRYGVEIRSKHRMLTEHFIAERIHSHELNTDFRRRNPFLQTIVDIATENVSPSIYLKIAAHLKGHRTWPPVQRAKGDL